jgi:hypothetical protein
VILNDREATRKYKKSKQFLDLCDVCFADVADQIETLENPLVSNSLDTHDYEED